MNTLPPDALLQRLPDLHLQLDPAGQLLAQSDERELRCRPEALTALDLFYRPSPVGAAVDRLLSEGYADAAALVEQLYAVGMLVVAEAAEPYLRPDSSNYDGAAIHVAMLNDRARVAGFLVGIREVVRPGDVVLDLGTGIGVFAIAAAQAGARHVYAVEAGAIGRLARANFAANGLADRITLIQGWSSQVRLPERADVLISEMVGNEPTHDYMLEVMRDARARLLKPDARMVPGRVRICGLPVTAPAALITEKIVIPAAAAAWRERYGLNCEHLLSVGGQPTGRETYSVRPYDARDWPTFSPPVLLAEVNLMNVEGLELRIDLPFTATADGMINATLVYFETELGPTTSLSLHPAAASDDTFRYLPVRLLREPLPVRAGERLTMTYRYRVPGEPDGVNVTRAEPGGGHQ